jgi:hypothetical protein
VIQDLVKLVVRSEFGLQTLQRWDSPLTEARNMTNREINAVDWRSGDPPLRGVRRFNRSSCY